MSGIQLPSRMVLAFLTTIGVLVGGPAFSQQSAATQQTSGSPQPEPNSRSAATGPPDCSRGGSEISADCRLNKPAEPIKPARENQPFDPTGYWVSIVSEEWRWRMMTPPKGDVASMPLNDAAKTAANAWDPANPEQCKAFGAAGMIRNPMRVRFTWDGDYTLRMETDHGQVTRVFHFDPAALSGAAPSAQGESVAVWEDGALKVVTTRLSPGFLRKNGVPYSDKTTLTEYFNRYTAFGTDYITVTSVVNDPVYLTREFVVTTEFKRLADGSAWNPTPCDAPLKLPIASAR